MDGDVGMEHVKNPLNGTIKDTSTIMCNPIHVFRQRVMHDCASILDSIAKGALVAMILHTASLHHSSFR